MHGTLDKRFFAAPALACACKRIASHDERSDMHPQSIYMQLHPDNT